MTFTIAIAFVYVVLMVLAGVIGLLVLNIAFARVFFRQWPGANPARYWPFVREHVSRRRLSLTLLRIPFLLTVLFVAVVTILCLTDTHRVRSNISRSTCLVVRSGGNCHRSPERERILFKTEDIKTIKELAAKIFLDLSVFGTHCMCCGDMTFDLYQGQELHYSFSLHHGQSIRNNRFTLGDKKLSSLSQQKLKDWLAQTGVTKSLTEIREQKEERMKVQLVEMKSLQESVQPEDSPDSE